MRNDGKFVTCTDNFTSQKRTIGVEDAKKILHENGLDVTTEEATTMLGFLYLFAVFSIENSKQQKHENS